MPMSTAPEHRVSLADIALETLWQLGCVLTLGYAPKYYLKILTWQTYDTENLNKGDNHNPSGSGDVNRTSTDAKKSSPRAKQQKEWDRLMVPLSVITATSAAALAIPSPFGTSNIYWLATAFYSGALGLSLEGLIIVTYLTVFGAGSSRETIGQIAKGKGFLKGMVGPVAVMTALPTAITTYSSLFLLAGLLAMTIVADKGSSIQEHMLAFKAIVLAPVCLMLACLVVTVAGCEFFAWKEGSTKHNNDVEEGTAGGDDVSAGGDSEPVGDSRISTRPPGTATRRRSTYENGGEA